jgi:hypothetical protein
VILEAVGAIEVTAHRGADGEANVVRRGACSSALGFERSALIEIAYDAALGESLDDRMMLVELIEH